MDSVSTFLKENYQLVCLLVGFVGVVIAILSLIDEIKKKRQNKNKD